MLSGAYVTLTCDGCGEEEQIALHIGLRDWTESGVPGAIRALGWTAISDTEHYCESCSEERAEKEK